MPDISSYLKKARQMDEEKGVAYKATPSTSTNSGAYTSSKSGVDISSYLKKAREMDANNATVSMPNANSQQKDERKQQQYLSYLAGLDLDAQKKKAEDLDKVAGASRPTNYFADAPQDSSSGYFDVAPETFQAARQTKEEAEAELAWKDYNLAKSLQYSIAGEQALDALNDDVYAEVDKLAQAWLSPDIYNTIAQGSTDRLRSAGYTDAEIEQLVDYRKRQINRSEYDEKVAKTEALADNGFWGAAGASAASVPQQLASGAGYIDLALQKLQNAYSGNDRPLDYYTQAMSYYGRSNAARGTVTENIKENAKTELGGKIGSFLYNTGMSMADFISVSPLGGAGMALLGSSAATATAVDIRDRGGDDTQALLGGALAGAAEAVFENESLKKLFALSKPAAKETLRSGFKRVLKNVAKQGWEEGKEELFTSLANAMTDRMVMGELSSYNTAVRDYMANGLSAEEAERKATMDFIVQCATDTLAGFVSGGVMGGVSTAARGYANYSSYDAKDLVDEALEINPDNAYAQGVKAKLDEGKRVGVGARYKLVQQNESAMRTQDKAAIQSAAAEQLTALGETGDVQAIAAAIAKQTAGEKLDKAEKAAIKDSEHGTAVAEDLNPDNTADWARKISTNKVNRDAYNADLAALAEEVVSEKQQADAEINKASEIGSQRLAANDQVYQTASKMFGEDKAFAVAAAYRSGANGLSAGEFLTGFAAAHQAGVNGTSLKKALAAQSNLRPEQVKIAWSLGNDERTSGIEVRNIKRQGTGTFTDKSTGKATDSWQAFTTVLEGIAKRTGIDFETVDAIKAGSQTANGKMVRDMMTLVLSRNAENNMQSLGHELGEFVEAFNPEDMASLRVDILRYWAKTQSATSVDKMVKAYQGTYKQAEGGKTYEQAESEAINDALGAILASEEGVDALMEWLQSDSGMNAQEQKTFLQKLADLFQSIVNALKKLLNSGNLTPMQQDMVHMEIEQKQDILKRLFAAVDKAALNARETGEYYADITLAEAGIAIDRETDSAHSLQFSTAYTDVVKVGKKSFDTEAIVKLVAEGTGRSIGDARKWVNSELTIANIVMQNPEFLDFEGDDRYTAIKNNSDYPQGTVDLSNLCPKREEFTTMFDMLQKKYPDKLFTAADVAEMRAILKKNNITVACGACFVEDRRQLLGEIADTYINMWKDAIAFGDTLQKVNAEGKKVPLYVTKAIAKKYGLQAGAKILATDTYVPTQYDLTTYEGFKTLQKEHPIIAMGFERYNNSRGQQAARLIEGRAEYDRQILGWSAAKVKRVNNSGGLRIFSFSDFEVVHLLDLVQVIMDCAAMGVKIQGYTKIPAFARLVRNTGIKLNRSLIPKGDTGIKVENGKRVLDIDTVEGIDYNDENFMDESTNPNVGNIIIGINPEQIGIAMLDDFIDYIIPFHSNKSKDILRKLGTGAWVNYKESQHEKDIATGKASKHNVNIYTQVLAKYKPKNKVEFVNAFLKECKAQGKIPRYAEFLNVDENGDYAYREGYHKLLVDFKMFDKAGNILPQTNIQPVLDDAFMAKLLADEVKRKQDYQFPEAVYKAIDEKFGDTAYSISPKLMDDLAAVRAGTFKAKNNEIYVGESSTFLVNTINADPLSVTMPPRKAYSAMVSEETAKAENRWEHDLDYHDLGEQGLYDALVASETPVAAFASLPDEKGNKRSNRIVLVTDYVHKGKAVAVVEEMDTRGVVGGQLKKVNKTVTAFDREWLFGDIEKAAADGRLLAYDKKRSQSLATRLGKTLRSDLRNVDFNANIRNFWENVKWAKTKKDSYTAAPPQETKTALAAALEKARAAKENATHDEAHSITPDRQSMSERTYAPTFYSHMARVVDGVKQEKLGAASVVSMLRGKGVKAEEIKWSGIEAWLEGKKSVTKDELQEFIAGSMLQIEEKIRTNEAGERYTAADTGEMFLSRDEVWAEAVRRAEELGYDEEDVSYTEDYRFGDGPTFTVSGKDGDIVLLSTVWLGDAEAVKWDDYKLNGGKNYREIEFVLPNSDYSNDAMNAHWGAEAKGVLAHARIQDMMTAGGKMLFVEEIQSDWHNAGQKQGYFAESDKVTVNNTEVRHENGWYNLYHDGKDLHQGVSETFLKQRFANGITDEEIHDGLVDEYNRSVEHSGKGWKASDAPFKKNYHEFVLKRLIRMAAEGGYDSIGWTTADIQRERWTDQYAEGYRIEYDQDIPKFMSKYGKKWGAKVEQSKVGGETVWSMTIPEAMKESVLYEGQPQYSLPVNGESMTKMTDREILSAAAEQVEATSLTNAERDALRIFNNRLDKLGELQSKRKELGDLYREQMFVKGKVDRVKAANTRSRMDALDNQIARAENEVLKAENTEVLKQILKQARKVVANEQRAHDNNTLQRYKERRNNAADVKKYRERVQKKSMKLAEMLMRNSDKQHIPEQLKVAVGEFLTTIDFTSRQQLRGGEATKKDLRYTDTLNKLRRVLQNQVNYMEDPEKSDGLGVYLDMPDGFVQAIEKHIESVENTLRNTDVATGSVNVMTADELKDLDFFLTVLTSSINKVNAFIANSRYELVSEAAMNSIAYLNAMREFGGNHTKVDKFLNWDNTTPYFAFKRFGDAGSAIFEGLQDGWDKLAFNSKQVINFAQETYTEKEVKEWSEKIHNIELDGRTAQMTTAQIMSLYCLVKREQARGHLFGGGMRIGNIEIKATVEKGKVKSKQDLQQAEAFHLTMEDVGRITKLLTERQVAVAEAMQKYMNTVGSKWGNEISFSRFGYNSFTEENYFPIESDRNNLPAIDPETRANDLFRLLNMCFTKGLTPKANNALVVNNIFDVFAAHMSDMAKYNALALPVLDAMKFYNFKDSTKQESGQLTTATVQKAIERAYGGSAKAYFIQFMKDLNGVHDGGRNESESFAMKMVGNYKVAAVGSNLRVALLQPTSYVRAVAVIDPKYLAKAATMKPATKEMLEHSGVAVWKSLGFYDTNIGRAVRDQIKGEATVHDKLVEASMSAAALGDKLTWGVLWNACKLECAAKGEKSTEAVAKRFREVVYATQVVDSTMTRSQTMRSNSNMTKMLTSFMSEPTLAYNMLADSYNTYSTLKRKGDKSAWKKCSKAITRSMMAYVAAMTAAALAESIFDALRDDDDYETFLEKFWEAFWGDKYGYDGKPVAGNLFADLNPLNKLPIIKDIVSEITGYKNTRMDTQWFSSIIDAAESWKSDTHTLYGKIYKTMQAFSRAVGLPVSNLMREVVTIYNNTIGVITGNKLKTYEGRVRTNIKDAMAGGHLTEDEAMRELVNKGEAKDMNEAYFIVKGWGTGDTSRYQDVYDAMLANESIAAAVKELTDHGYEKKDVLSTVKSQIGKWYKGTDDKPASITRQQALSMLVKYGELTRDEANSKLNTWDSQKNK